MRFIAHFNQFSDGSYDETLLELGPGGSLLNGIMGRVLGFDLGRLKRLFFFAQLLASYNDKAVPLPFYVVH